MSRPEVCIPSWGVLIWGRFFYFFFFFPLSSFPSESVPDFTKVRQDSSHAYCVALNEVFYFDWSSVFATFSGTSSSATKSFVDS